jgi:hypothetical protein
MSADGDVAITFQEKHPLVKRPSSMPDRFKKKRRAISLCGWLWHPAPARLRPDAWRKPVGVEPTCDTEYRTTGLKPAPGTGQE